MGSNPTLSAILKKNIKEQCLDNVYVDCKKQAVYIRHTQFAGSYLFCEEHAKEDKVKIDSYQF